LTYVVQRILLTIPALLGATVLVFLLIHLAPGDPAVVLAGPDASAADLQRIRQSLALDQPYYAQYVRYLQHLLRGDLGQSYFYRDNIAKLVARTAPATVTLSAVALVFSLLVAIPIGILAATRRNSWVDHASMAMSVLGISVPVFWLGIMLIYLFAVSLNWLPASGRGGPIWTPDGLAHIVLPAVSLGVLLMASTTRLTRAAMLEVLQEDYIRTARAKGTRERAVLYRHALRNASITIVTNIGLQIGGLLSGAFLTETVFAWPGIGRLTVDAMFRRDYPLVQGALLMVVCGFIVVNLFVDLLYGLLDPRIGYQ